MNKYAIIVVGAGHAGVEAAVAAAKRGFKTLVITGNLAKVASMPCNPSMGGPAKGTIIREIDALGGVMAKQVDLATLQIKLLNSSKGPAVQTLRAQVDKLAYPRQMLALLQKQPGLSLVEKYVSALIVESGKVAGVETADGTKYFADAVILSTGTYLAANVLYGHTSLESGPEGQKTSFGISRSLQALGFQLKRLKTGTPPRIARRSIDYSQLKIQTGDRALLKFSEETPPKAIRPFEQQVVCHLTYTSPETKQFILANLGESSMYSGLVHGIGPRYCPSIEDKIVRFQDKERHQIFLEPESLESEEIYLQGLSTSFPHALQEAIVRSVKGLERAEIVRYAYAIEYDAIDSRDLKPSLEAKSVENLFFAGQINGTSGYEEAAAQGLIAGINATLKLEGKAPLILGRDEAYIGVLIDDLVTKGVIDPYRMLTSRAEHRLLLRHDNAEERLIKYGYRYGLISAERYFRFRQEAAQAAETLRILEKLKITPKPAVNEYLRAAGKIPLTTTVTALAFLRRSETDFTDLEQVTGLRTGLSPNVQTTLLTKIKYAGYINKENKQVRKLRALERKKLPDDIDYDAITNLASEGREKLKKIRPVTIAQASRISGVNPSDIAILLVYLEGRRHGK